MSPWPELLRTVLGEPQVRQHYKSLGIILERTHRLVPALGERAHYVIQRKNMLGWWKTYYGTFGGGTKGEQMEVSSWFG